MVVGENSLTNGGYNHAQGPYTVYKSTTTYLRANLKTIYSSSTSIWNIARGATTAWMTSTKWWTTAASTTATKKLSSSRLMARSSVSSHSDTKSIRTRRLWPSSLAATAIDTSSSGALKGPSIISESGSNPCSESSPSHSQKSRNNQYNSHRP